MLALSPPLPLVIHYMDIDRDITEAEEKGIVLALRQRRRVHRIRFLMPTRNLKRLIKAIDEEYPELECLTMMSSTGGFSEAWKLSTTFPAPHLRCLLLKGRMDFPARLMATESLVRLYLLIDGITFFCTPYTMFLCTSAMRQLETLQIIFDFPFSDYDAEKLLQRPIMSTLRMTHVTYPNLRWFEFQGASVYLEAFVQWINVPRLEKLNIQFKLSTQPTFFSVPHLLRFMDTAKNIRFDNADFEFFIDRVSVGMNLREEEAHALSIAVYCAALDWQVSSLAQIFYSLSQKMSTVEYLNFESEGLDDEANRTEWRGLLKSFSNVKTLNVDVNLVGELSRCLRPNDGEHPLEVLPELQKLSYTGGTDDIGERDTFTSFLDARQNAGHPVNLSFLNKWTRGAARHGAAKQEAVRRGVTSILEAGSLCEPPNPVLLPTPLYLWIAFIPTTPTVISRIFSLKIL